MTHAPTSQTAEALSPFIRPTDLAAYLGVSDETIYRRIADGSVPAARLGRLWLIPREFAEQLLEPAHA